MTNLIISLFVVLTVVFLSVAVGLIQSFGDLKYEVKRYFLYQVDTTTVYNAKNDVLNKINSNHEELLTEIACLATKNNADIQRVREGYKPGDIIEYNGEQYMVLKINQVSTDLGLIMDTYRVYSVTNGEVDLMDRNVADKNSKFLRHVDLGGGE